MLPRKGKRTQKPDEDTPKKPVTLKSLAQYLSLSPATVSIVINQTPLSASIPETTKLRVMQAARKFNYRPNIIARSLRQQRTYSVGVLIPELSDGYSAMVLSGIEDFLLKKGFAWLAASHRHKKQLLLEYPKLLYDRAVEGLILVDTPIETDIPCPVICVSGHMVRAGVTNIVLNHDRAAELALGHLASRGHKRIAFIKGQAFSSDTDIRWRSIQTIAKRLGLEVSAGLTSQMHSYSPSPEVGYDAMKKILSSGEPFTALFAFNDISAIGAIRALQESGRRVPEDVSVVGFDDIRGAAFHIPSLTTIRQPLHQMGSLAAEKLLEKINAPNGEFPATLQVEPKLMVRESTARVKNK